MEMATADLSKRELTDWLDLLIESNEGQIKVINLYHSFILNLINEDILRTFVNACIAMKPATAASALNVFKDICQNDDRFFALNPVDPSSISAAAVVSTTISSLAFHQFFLARPSTIIKSTMSAKPQSRRSSDESSYRKKLKRTVSSSKWYNDDGTLGKTFPDPRHVWFTDGDHMDKEVRSNPSGDSEATKVRDALGLIETKSGTYLLALKFSARHLHTLLGLKIARPTFSDTGNSRFAVYINADAEPLYGARWGQTVHLHKLRNRRTKINGLPERICSPIPLAHIGASLSVSPIGWVDVVGDADDETFINQLLGPITIEDIKLQLSEIANKP